MNASATINDTPVATLSAAASILRADLARPHGWARSMVGRLATGLRARRRKRRTHGAFGDAYEVLHRLDERVLLDIGIRPEQVTAFAQAAMASPRRAGATVAHGE